MTLPDGYAILVSCGWRDLSRDRAGLRQLADLGLPVTFVSQNDPGFLEGVAGVVDDQDLELSWRLKIELTPTAVRITDGTLFVLRLDGRCCKSDSESINAKAP